MKADKLHIEWYDSYYKTEQMDFTSWYAFMLPELAKVLKGKEEAKVLELGCGQSKGSRWLVKNDLIDERNIYGIDQSQEAVNFSKSKLPQANIQQGDIYNLPYEDNSFDFIMFMEVIEHLENPEQGLKEIYRILKPGGKVFISFPNYYNFPWFIARILSEKLNKPNWINLQPVDKCYGTVGVINFCKMVGLGYEKCVGSNYFPPIFYKYESLRVTGALNRIGLNHFSFHPVLIFNKK